MMRLRALALTLGAGLCIELGAQVPSDTIARTERERVVREIRALVEQRFAHFAAIPDFDLAREGAAYRERALATPSRWEFSLLTRAFIASARNGHTTFSDGWLSTADPALVPFALRDIEGRWTVTSSRQPGIVVGDVIASVDDSPVEGFFRERIEPYVAGSDERARRREFTTRGFLWPRHFVVTLEDGRRVSVERSVSPVSPTPPRAVVRDQWIDSGRVAYLAIGSFGAAEHEERAVKLLAGRYLRAEVLVLDLRGNGGGNTPRRLMTMLLNGAEPVWWKEDPDRAPNAAMNRFGAMFRRRGGGPQFAGRIVVLADDGCASSCEDLLMPLKWTKRAIVVGDTTLGTTGQPVFLRFENGMQVTVGAKRAHFPDGSPFEGVGIAPDVLLPRTRADLVSGVDRALERATELARAPKP